MEQLIIIGLAIVIVGVVSVIVGDSITQKRKHDMVEDERIAYENKIAIKELL